MVGRPAWPVALLALFCVVSAQGNQSLKKIKVDELATRYPEQSERLRGEYFAKARLLGDDIVVMNLSRSTVEFEFKNDGIWLPISLRSGIARILPKAKGLRALTQGKMTEYKARAGTRFAFEQEKDSKKAFLVEAIP